MLDFLATLWNFIWTLLTNWIVYMTAFPLILDDLIKWCSPSTSAWIEKKLSGERRRKAEMYFIFGGFFIASFMAFDGEHEARTKAEADNQTLAKQIYAMSPSGQLEEIKGLRKDLVSEKIAFSEIELKQQQEIDSVKTSTSKLDPRTITDADRSKFIAELANAPKGPVAVITISEGAEVINFASKLRSMLDDAGYSDPDKKAVTSSLASFQSSNAATSMMAVLPKDAATFGGPVQSALKSIGIPADGTVDNGNVLQLKPGEIAVVVLAR